MDSIFIFGAKYLWIIPVALAIFFIYKASYRAKILKFGAISLPLSYIFGLIARALYDNPRPFVVGGFEPLIEHAADNGFPSDHVLLVASIAAAVLIYNRKAGVILWAIAIFVAISRVYTGVHHPIDVISSIAISILSAAVVYYIRKHKQNASDNPTAKPE